MTQREIDLAVARMIVMKAYSSARDTRGVIKLLHIARYLRNPDEYKRRRLPRRDRNLKVQEVDP